jgi:replicative DNA helicase
MILDRAPVAVEAEEGFISAMLADPESVCPLLAGQPLPPEAWMSDDCRSIVGSAMRRWREREPVDAILIGSDLRGRVEPARMMQIATLIAAPAAAGHYLELLTEAWHRRQVISACLKAQRVATEATSSEALAVLSAVGASINGANTSRVSALRDILRETIAELSSGEPPTMVRTGWKKLDAISPVQAGDVVVVAAPPKGGKSTLALSYAAAVAQAGGNVLILSLEMSSGLIGTKLLSAKAQVPLAKFLARDFSEGDTHRIGQAVKTMSQWEVEVRDDVRTLDQVVGAARLACARKPLTMLVVDYIQLVQGPRDKNTTREQEVAAISRTLRLLAMETGAVIVALSQLNKEGGVRESQAIVQDATAIWKVTASDDDGHKTITVTQRNGESPASCDLRFRGYISTFSDD